MRQYDIEGSSERIFVLSPRSLDVLLRATGEELFLSVHFRGCPFQKNF